MVDGLTANIDAGASQHMTPAVMAHEVVSGALAGPGEPREGDAEHGGAQNAVGAAGKTLSVQRPVERACVNAVVWIHWACGCQAGADGKGRVLRVDCSHIWGRARYSRLELERGSTVITGCLVRGELTLCDVKGEDRRPHD